MSAFWMVADPHILIGNPTQALLEAEHSLSLQERFGPTLDTVLSAGSAALAAAMLGRPEDAREYVQSALELAQAADEQGFVAAVFDGIAVAEHTAGHFAAAVAAARRCVELTESFEISGLIRSFFLNTAIVVTAPHDLTLSSSFAALRSDEDPSDGDGGMRQLADGVLALHGGDYSTAWNRFAASAAACQRLGYRSELYWVVAGLVMTLSRTNRLPEAVRLAASLESELAERKIVLTYLLHGYAEALNACELAVGTEVFESEYRIGDRTALDAALDAIRE